MKRVILSQETLQQRLSYDADTGLFTWRVNLPASGIKIGDPVGYPNACGHLVTRWYGRTQMLHRLAWLYVYGKLPACQIDHINGVPDDNRIINLRDVTHSGNSQNQRRAHKNSSSGYLGVDFVNREKLWRARITVNKKPICLGYFKSPEVAFSAYLDAKRKFHECCTI